MPFLGKKPTEIASPVDINSGSIDGTTIGGGSASPATVTTFTSTGIDDNAASTAITIDSSGNVGVNNSNPQSPLEINNVGTSDPLTLELGGQRNFSAATYGATAIVATSNGTRGSHDFGAIRFEQNPVTGDGHGALCRLFAGGESSSFASKNEFLRGTAVTTGVGVDNVSIRTNDTERMRVDASGDLLVGTTGTPSTSVFGFRVFNEGNVKLSKNVDGSGFTFQAYGNAGVFRIMGDGDAQNTNNSYGGLSDERLKSNIVDASSQIDDIMAVQVRSYTLNETGDKHIGVVAQELEAAGMSGLVKTDDEGMKSVKYSILYMKAIKAIQEQQTIIDSQASAIADLTTRLEALEAN